MKRYRFTVVYQSSLLAKVSAFMRQLDLGTGEIVTRDIFTFNYSGEDKPISYFKSLIEIAFSKIDCVVHKIEGGPIE